MKFLAALEPFATLVRTTAMGSYSCFIKQTAGSETVESNCCWLVPSSCGSLINVPPLSKLVSIATWWNKLVTMHGHMTKTNPDPCHNHQASFTVVQELDVRILLCMLLHRSTTRNTLSA